MTVCEKTVTRHVMSKLFVLVVERDYVVSHVDNITFKEISCAGLARKEIDSVLLKIVFTIQKQKVNKLKVELPVLKF